MVILFSRVYMSNYLDFYIWVMRCISCKWYIINNIKEAKLYIVVRLLVVKRDGK